MNINNDEKKLLGTRVTTAIDSFSFLQRELEASIYCINESIEHMELQVVEMTKTLDVLNQTKDINSSLFSPYDNSCKLVEIKKIQDKLRSINEKLPTMHQEANTLIKRQESFCLIRDCLEYLQSITNSTSVEEVKIVKENNLYLSESLSVEEIEKQGVKILETRELERQRIARDLHDSTLQNLTNLIHKTELCLKLIDIDFIRAKLEIATMTETIRSVISNMREIIYNLRPMMLQDIGLIPSIESFIKSYMQNHGIQVQLIYQNELKKVLPVISLSIYRIIQEACNNIAKYSKATNCKIILNYKDSFIELIIEDNGIGMEEKLKHIADSDNKGFGLSIMRERALLLSGEFMIKSEKGKGTLIIVTIPYHEQKGENSWDQYE